MTLTLLGLYIDDIVFLYLDKTEYHFEHLLRLYLFSLMNFLIKTQFVSYYSPAMLAYINWYLLNESSGIKDPFVKNLFVNYKNSKRLYATLQAKQTEFLDLFIYECRAHGKEAWVVIQNDL